MPASHKVPAEIWLDILDLVPSTADLHSVSVTCKKFHDLSVRALHRGLSWTRPQHIARSLPIWDNCHGMDAAVRSLELGVSSIDRAVGFDLVGLNGQLEPSRSGRRRIGTLADTINHYKMDEQAGGFASRELYEAMFARIHTFTNLSSLAFTNMLVYDVHFELIHRLPALRSLRLELCVFQPSPGGQTLNHADLPITELTMVNLRRVLLNREPLQYDEDITHALTLCLARNLRTLTVDSSADVFRRVFGAWDAPQRGWTIPAQLTHVYVVRRRLFAGEVQPLYRGESSFPETYLYHFAVQAHALRTLWTPLFAPANMTIAHEALPPRLQCFAAPVETAAAVAGVRALEALGIFKCGLGGREAINALESVAAKSSNLKMLMLELKANSNPKGWDEEVISAVTDLFKGLRRLKIVYEGPEGPTEDFLVMLAPEFLSKLPHLHTLELYPQPGQKGTKPHYPVFLHDASFESLEEELRNIVIPYNRYCPELRRVQLCSGYVMARTCTAGRWELERIRRLPEKDDLSY
ncbi:hypothetical protein C8Q78DRAFT_967203 [Trametes maxima]|nr:hypothetical protein C8Q78DRAFT_967203 [Trametes maxima]